MINIIFFAKYREQFGAASLELPAAGITSVKELILHLREYFSGQTAFLDDQKMIISVNQELAGAAQKIGDGDVVAFFPPVTGG